jgi:hypothetical protein
MSTSMDHTFCNTGSFGHSATECNDEHVHSMNAILVEILSSNPPTSGCGTSQATEIHGKYSVARVPTSSAAPVGTNYPSEIHEVSFVARAPTDGWGTNQAIEVRGTQSVILPPTRSTDGCNVNQVTRVYSRHFVGRVPIPQACECGTNQVTGWSCDV